MSEDAADKSAMEDIRKGIAPADDAASATKKKDDAKPGDAAQEATPPAAKKPEDDDAKRRIDQLESQLKELRDKSNSAEEVKAKEEYIAEKMGDFPKELARLLLPTTKDMNTLAGAERRAREWLSKLIDAGVANGTLKRIDVNPTYGGSGGTITANIDRSKNASASDLIREGLRGI